MNIIFWILIGMAFYAIGEYNSKLYANTTHIRYGVIALIGYMLNAACFLPAISKLNSLTVLGTIWNLGYVFVTLFIGIVLFRETLTPTQIAGMILGVISIILLSI